MTRWLAIAACLALSGCLSPAYLAALASAGTAAATLTNADVSAAKAYCQWRGGCQEAPAAPAAAAAP